MLCLTIQLTVMEVQHQYLSVYTVVHLTCGFFYTKKKVE